MKNKLFLCMIILATFTILYGCDSGLEIVGMKICNYPDRIVYIAGNDNALDLTGGTVKYLLKQNTEFIDKMDNSMYITITHNIDFKKLGIYEVILTRGKYSCSFPVQVIDETIFIGNQNN